MAILFGLVVNCGTSEQMAESAAGTVRRAGHIEVRGVSLPIGGPVLTWLGSPPDRYLELAVYVIGIGYGRPGAEPGLDPRSLTADEITQAGHALYDLLRGMPGYRAAVVGWNPESLVDVAELEADWRTGDPPGYNGLVLAADLCERWGLGPEWVHFSDGYRWLPYSGSKNPWRPG